MDPFPLVISFYTVDTPYEQEVMHLRRSCEQFAIDHHIASIVSTGSWEMNCAFKPLFILQMLEEKKCHLLWVDADAVFVQKPSPLAVFSQDLGVRMYDCSDDHPSRIVSATLFVNHTVAAKHVLRLWAEECLLRLKDPDRTQEMWDQDALRHVLFTKAHHACYQPLPIAYSKIIGHVHDEAECANPVIVQHQASRRYKRWIHHPEERLWGW